MNHSDNPSQRQLALDFEQVQCTCGLMRVSAMRCAECDEGPDEDAGLDRRRGAARAAAELFDAPLPKGSAGDLDPAAWLSLLSNYLPDMMAACAAVVDEDDDGQGLAAVVRFLRETTAAACATSRYRPWRRGWSQLDAVLNALGDATRCWVEVLRTEVPQEAMRLGREAQVAIDASAQFLDDWAASHDLADAMEARLGDGELGTLEVLVGHIVASRSVTNADAEGAELFERVVGSRECPTGLGIALLVTEAQVHTVMDEQRFWNNAREAYGLLAPGMSKVTSSEAWLSDMLGLAEELHEAAMQIQLNVPRLDRPDVLARTFVRTGHVLTERVAKYLLATLLAANRDKSYAELRTRDFGDLLQQCRDLGWAGLTEGIDKALRHADAHKLFIVATDGVRFTAERREYDWLSWHELIDRVLLCYESVLALDTAVLCTFVASGGEVESIDPLRNLSMDAFDKTRVAMRLCGLAVTDLNYPDESTLHIHADASFAATSSQSGFLAGGLYYLLRRADGPVPDCIEIVVNAPGGPVVWRGPTAPLSAHAQALSDSDRTASMIESGIVWTRDGEPLLPHGAGRQGAARALVEAPVNDLPAATRHMRPWLSLAVRLKDRELTSLLRTLLRTWRRRSMSQPADPGYVEAFTALLSWRDLVADADDAPRAA